MHKAETSFLWKKSLFKHYTWTQLDSTCGNTSSSYLQKDTSSSKVREGREFRYCCSTHTDPPFNQDRERGQQTASAAMLPREPGSSQGMSCSSVTSSWYQVCNDWSSPLLLETNDTGTFQARGCTWIITILSQPYICEFLHFLLDIIYISRPFLASYRSDLHSSVLCPAWSFHGMPNETEK